MLKKAIITMLILLLGMAVGQNDVKKRFEHLQRESTGEGVEEYYHFSPDNIVYSFNTYHDKESGIEFICARGYSEGYGVYPLSCFPTGRKWKKETN